MKRFEKIRNRVDHVPVDAAVSSQKINFVGVTHNLY